MTHTEYANQFIATAKVVPAGLASIVKNNGVIINAVLHKPNARPVTWPENVKFVMVTLLLKYNIEQLWNPNPNKYLKKLVVYAFFIYVQKSFLYSLSKRILS